MSVFGFFVFERFDHLFDLFYPSSNDTVLAVGYSGRCLSHLPCLPGIFFARVIRLSVMGGKMMVGNTLWEIPPKCN